MELELNKVSDRLVDHNVSLSATPEALDLIAKLGYDPEMGARPLKRVIQQKVEDRMSDLLLSGEFQDGDQIIIDDIDGELILTRQEFHEPVPSA